MNLSRVKPGMVVEIKHNGYHAYGVVTSKHHRGKNISIRPLVIRSQESDGYIRYVGDGFIYLHYPHEVVSRFKADDFKEKYPEYVI